MLKYVTPAFGLALLAHAVLAGPPGVTVRLQTPEAFASACKLAPGFQSAGLWQQDDRDDDVYVRTLVADARSTSGVRAAVARFKAELQDRAAAEAIAKQRFVSGRLTLAGCATYAAYGSAEDLFPPLQAR
jgi:hypothetical protein